MSAAPATTAVAEYCTFEVGGLFLGVDVACVQEVLRYLEITAVPLASTTVRGLINLRGQIVTAVDLRRRLGLEDLDGGRLPLNVVIRVADRTVSLLVDAIGDVITTDAPMEPPPQTAKGVALDVVRGVVQLEGRLMLVLDAARATELVG